MDDEAPEGARERLWNLINSTPNLIWQLLTKRPHRYSRYLPSGGFVHKNAWLGTSAENQQFYNVRWPLLRLVCLDLGLVSFISYEPAIGPLSIEPSHLSAIHPRDFPDWMIAGGESGTHRRPMQTEWFEKVKAECEAHGVKFFCKQMSARTPEEGAKLIPSHLLIRQFPNSLGDNNAS